MEAIVGNTFYFDFEVRLMEALQQLLGETGALFVSNFSAFGEEFLLIIIMGFLYWCYDKKFGIFVGTNLVVGIIANPMIKNVFLRRRPYFDNPGIKCFRPVEKGTDIYDISAQGFSFPSGHSTNSVTVYSAIAKYGKKKALTILAVVMPLLVGFSRVSVGVHYPTDVLVGWLSGLVIVFLLSFLMGKFYGEKRWLLNLIIFLVSCLGYFYCKTDDYFASLGIMAGFFVGIEFDEKNIRFKNTKNILKCILRVVCGGAIFLAFNTVLKMPFSKDFLASGTLLAHLVRTLRYGISTFIVVGVYPICFDRFLKEKSN
ncbi:phosphatase PAP2 family protein [Butyrivibrio sp. YAB3001]|uniref:phosphatase PAP2 family protein n=1 Tax=Butyrivibrio sp. YAB3001 TaxID=1520812 RepID=UPI0008F68679|nr:phosphatase PAP2 family protein [Butyrivibrio sp. YAB3001]SFC80872.1 Membrane-associated phospholipid phosphatase [Butyrivibrio sp. YAB3001]